MDDKKSTILRIALATPLRRCFDYLLPSDISPNSLKVGARIAVPFRNQEKIGILIEVLEASDVPVAKLKKIHYLIDSEPLLPPDILQLCRWSAEYYHHSLGEVFDAALPVILRQGKPASPASEAYWQFTAIGKALDLSIFKKAKRQAELFTLLALHPEGLTPHQLQIQGIATTVTRGAEKKGWIEKCFRQAFVKELPAAELLKEKPLVLNSEQEVAVQEIVASKTFQVFLLDGVTGSGKTEVYLQAIENILKQSKQVLVLVPEIGLTPQAVQRFRDRFACSVVAMNSSLSDKERLSSWIAIKNNLAKILIGTRSAIFTPFAHLGLIIVDEEHDVSFKQQEGFRYHARDLAIKRAQLLDIPIVLGSATASLESFYRADQNKYRYLRLSMRAGEAVTPNYYVIDIRNLKLEEGVSAPLLKAMTHHLENNEQVMLFLNRRGFAPVYMCHSCGWVAVCKRCDARMTYHSEPPRLQCHHCDARRMPFKQCEKCKAPELHVVGLGTERLEQILKKHFPQYSIARIDRDSTQRRGAMEELLQEIQAGKHQILIGTQMLAKGHHFPNVTLVGVLDIDGGFFSSDFRAIEKVGQLVLQVSGRAGRLKKQGSVLIQTHHPDHPLLHHLLHEAYQQFARNLLKERAAAVLPPYSFFALFRAESMQVKDAEIFLREVKKLLESPDLAGGSPKTGVTIQGPITAPMPKRAGRYRMQLLLHAENRGLLQHYLQRLIPEVEKLKSKQQVRWSLDVDPQEMF